MTMAIGQCTILYTGYKILSLIGQQIVYADF